MKKVGMFLLIIGLFMIGLNTIQAEEITLEQIVNKVKEKMVENESTGIEITTDENKINVKYTGDEDVSYQSVFTYENGIITYNATDEEDENVAFVHSLLDTTMVINIIDSVIELQGQEPTLTSLIQNSKFSIFAVFYFPWDHFSYETNGIEAKTKYLKLNIEENSAVDNALKQESEDLNTDFDYDISINMEMIGIDELKIAVGKVNLNNFNLDNILTLEQVTLKIEDILKETFAYDGQITFTDKNILYTFKDKDLEQFQEEDFYSDLESIVFSYDNGVFNYENKVDVNDNELVRNLLVKKNAYILTLIKVIAMEKENYSEEEMEKFLNQEIIPSSVENGLEIEYKDGYIESLKIDVNKFKITNIQTETEEKEEEKKPEAQQQEVKPVETSKENNDPNLPENPSTGSFLPIAFLGILSMVGLGIYFGNHKRKQLFY